MTGLTPAAALAAAARLAPHLAERAAGQERSRILAPETLDEVTGAGLWPLVVPTSLGGAGLGVDTLAGVTRILARGCPASAWTVSFLVMHNWMLGRFPAAARAELFSPERSYALAPAPLAPAGTARRVEGGYLVSGRWEWATGVNHAGPTDMI